MRAWVRAKVRVRVRMWASRGAVHTSSDEAVSLTAGCLSTGTRLAGRIPRCLPSLRRMPKRRLPSVLKEQTTPGQS